MRIKLRHGVVLAVAGYYLIVPPFSATVVRYDAPLSEWQPVESYSSAAECEKGKRTKVEQLTAFAREQKMPRSAKIEALSAGKCIEADDPRLRK